MSLTVDVEVLGISEDRELVRLNNQDKDFVHFTAAGSYRMSID